MKKNGQSPIVFLALLLLSLSLTLTVSMARESIRKGSLLKDEAEASPAPVLGETSTNFIWQSILHRF